MNHPPCSALLLALSLCVLPAVAFAHPGHGLQGLYEGLWHPLLGVDHLLALCAAGLWAAQTRGGGRWWVPLSFLVALAAGFGLAQTGGALPGVEPGIAASVVVLGLLVAGAAGLPALAGGALVAVFAVLHGYAHASELAAGSLVLAYGAGLLVTSAAVLGAAVGVGAVLRRMAPLWLRGGGVGIAVGGALIYAGL